MASMLELVHDGSVTSPRGYLAGATYAGLKTLEEDALDLGILVSQEPAALAATFTTNRIESPSVTLSRQRASKSVAKGVVANSGCANCCVGSQGLADAKELAFLAANHVGIGPEEMLVCSTGMIGVELPMALLRQNVGNVNVTADGGHMFARAIMTTDTRPKDMAVSLEMDGRRITIGGTAKGVGMVHPNMATMLAFITTDAAVEPGFLATALRQAVGVSFNMIDVDGDQSTNDTVLLFANGAAGGPTVEVGSDSGDAFQDALTYVCTGLAKELTRDGEGAQHLVEVVVDGARTEADARVAAREIASSSLVKAMVHGLDPNWGRIMMALGKSGVEVDESKIDIFVSDIHIVHGGIAIPYFRDAVVSAMNVPEVGFRISLNLGEGSATAWGCDLTEEYVTFNSAYST
ncbi:MAG: bifunctional glutamate N-acetyltransferase/amino-acid acetyltransferase ArgJ [Chloroflexi bacterium]|nr:bifunctional glutamate N-acetyltransferase/amino-acid acetyltransferase ArgJ [Chloroflexota bacterium]